MIELKQPVVTEDDVLKGSKEVEVLGRDGKTIYIMVTALSWRTALGATFKSVDQAMIHMLENCVPEQWQKYLDKIIPLHLVWITNVAQQLTNGIDSLKKATAATAATPPVAVPSGTSSPSSAS